MTLEAALQTFIAESRELLMAMETALLHAEDNAVDADLINTIFRAAHTIKGSAGLFDLDEIVEFTHLTETVLDCVRSGEIPLEKALIGAMLKAHDHMSALINAIANNDEPTPAVREFGQATSAQLRKFLHREILPATTSEPAVEKLSSFDDDTALTNNWHLSLRFGVDILRNGMDPRSCLQFLGQYGAIIRIVTLADNVPRLSLLDAENCHLGFEINFCSDADKETIESAFEFVSDGSTIRILPPRSQIIEYLRLIQNQDESNLRLGEILIRCGTLTSAELQIALLLQAETRPLQPIGKILVEQSFVENTVVEAALERQSTIRQHDAQKNHSIRVDASKLDELIDLVGELIIAGAGATTAAQLAGVPTVIESTTLLARMVERVRDSALHLRMVRIGPTLDRFKRLVRDIGEELGKEIDLSITGGDTELDRTMVEKIGDPLLHLVRNAIDHGICAPDVREANGKARRGQLQLRAYHDAGSVVIEVKDDGRGLQKQKILRRALEENLISETHSLSEQEIFNLIFEPGFSTANSVSHISGRGVGMDVVKQNITDLRGTVELHSVEGEGTTVRIRLPLTLAIIDGFLVSVGNATYALPLEAIIECIEFPASARGTKRQYIDLRGEVLPCVNLREVFNLPPHEVKRENVLVVQSGTQRVGLVVDRLLGEFHTVIKPLGDLFNRTPGISGFTILGSGDIALILDIPALTHHVMQFDGPARAQAQLSLVS